MTIDTLEIIASLALAVTSLLCMVRTFGRDLMMLQQNSYRNERYMRWFVQSHESTNIWRILLYISLGLMLIRQVPFWTGAIVASIVTMAHFISLSKRQYKKPLVWTARAKRIFAVMVVLTALTAGFALVIMAKFALVMMVAVLALSPWILLLANDILRPVEKYINKKYYDDAAGILASMPDLKIIGITGSYGKTSTKHYLNRILQEHFSTMMTPGSFNTTMGVIRTIREHLQPYNEVFIVEMGAKQLGDIKEICDLVHPTMGIVTAVGEQHLESFKSIENVQRTKFELADALPKDGLAVVNNDFPYAANRSVGNTRCIRYAVSNGKNADFTASQITYSPSGTTFVVTGRTLSEPLELRTKLVGECNVSNLLAAVIIALELGVPADKIRYAVGQIEQVEHRLNMKRTPGGITIIDDAFNSNPHGSKMAMDVLAMMKNGKRIVVTPGMIELGKLQEKANAEFGRHISRCADVAIIVGNYNRDAILAGIKAGEMPQENIHTVDTFSQAQDLLKRIAAPGDTVLYENDLPDTFK